MLCLFQIYSDLITCIFFQIIFPYKLLQNVKCQSLYYIVGPHWLSILLIVVYICQSLNPNLSPSFPLCNHKFVFYVYGSISVL